MNEEQLQAELENIKFKLIALGPEPHRPGPITRRLHKRGDVLMTSTDMEREKKHQAWSRKRSALMRRNTELSNQLFYLRQNGCPND